MQCVVCKSDIRIRQDVVVCDSCRNSQHRICGSGISQRAFKEAKRSKYNFHVINDNFSIVMTI